MNDMNSTLSFTVRGFMFGGVQIDLNETTILLTRDEVSSDRPHVYRDIRDAFNSAELSNADIGRPATVYIAPGVYWIDDPHAKDIMRKKDGDSTPIGMHVNCRALNIIGLTDGPADTVIAGNRGQSHACDGNYTMFFFHAEELNVSNITLGNYCNVDLDYPLDPSQSFPKRTEAITQAQLAFQQGDKLFAKNCRFISRLNLCPIGGAKRALYENCHFECTDDALNGDAVHINCDFDFYGSRPIYQTYGTGGVFIGCIFRNRPKNSDTESNQYFTKEGGPLALIDCRFEDGGNVRLGWTKYPDASLRCYQYRVTQNGKPVVLDGDNAAETVLLDGKKALEAYVIERDGRLIPNIANLLGGDDGWNPMCLPDDGKETAKVGLPTLLTLTADNTAIISGEGIATLSAQSYLFSNVPCGEKAVFSIRKGGENYVTMRQSDDGSCTVEGKNNSAEAQIVIIEARTESGLEAAAEIIVEPYVIDAPVCTRACIKKSENTAVLNYELSNTERKDISDISWYRCDTPEGGGAVLCGVSRPNSPLRTYHFTEADAGKYLKAVILPKLTGSLTGSAYTAVMTETVEEQDVDTSRIFTDFSEVPLENRTEFTKGIWICDSAKPSDFGTFVSTPDQTVPAWKHGITGNGSVGEGIYQNTQGSRLRYTPVHGHVGGMCVTAKVDPAKTAGQGFGGADQYLDIGVKFDNETLSGCALRVIRVKEASDAVAMALVEYRNGESRYLTEPQLTSCFLTGCTLTVTLDGGHLTAFAGTDTPQPKHKIGKYAHEVHLEAEVDGNQNCGVMIWHTGTIGSGGWQNTAMLHSVTVEYR